MRPVNLIPPEERRGERAPLRAGRLAYVLIGGLAVAVAAVTALVLTGNQVKDREAELVGLERELAAATQQAEALTPYAQFASLSESRIATVTSLAQSRFDWERVLRELALVLPDDVWLTSLDGSVSGGGGGGEASAASDGSIAGPSLTMIGCGEGHQSVARFLQALKDIDGVTRVGLARSELPEDDVAGAQPSSEGGGAGAGGGGGECQTRDFIAEFEAIVAFDGVSAVAAAPAPPVAPEAGEIADAQAEQEETRASAEEQVGEAREATNLVPGVAR